MPKLNGQQLASVAHQLISDLLRTGDIQYDVDNEHDKRLDNDEREQLKNARYRELIAVTNSILEEFLRDQRKFLENVQVQQAEDGETSAISSKSTNTSSSGENAIEKEGRRTMKRATGQLSSSSKRSPNPNGGDDERVTAKLVRLVQDLVDQAQYDSEYNLHEDADFEEDPYNNSDDYYDYMDDAYGYSGVDDTGYSDVAEENGMQRKNYDDSKQCNNCDGNGNRPNDGGNWDKTGDYIQYWKSVSAKLRQYPYNRDRAGEDRPRYRICKEYCPPWWAPRRNLYRRSFNYPIRSCYRCLLNINAPNRFHGDVDQPDDTRDQSQEPAEMKNHEVKP